MVEREADDLAALLTEMERLSKDNITTIVKLHALSAMYADAVSALSAIRDRQLSIIDRIGKAKRAPIGRDRKPPFG